MTDSRIAATFAGSATPDLETFRRLARNRRVIPVVRRLLADGQTPVGLYRALCGERAGTFLLESAEHGRSWARYSFVGVRSAAMLTEINGEATWLGHAPIGVPSGGDPVAALRGTIDLLHTERLEGLPPLTGGMSALRPMTSYADGSACPTATLTSCRSPRLGSCWPVILRCWITGMDRCC